MSTLKTHNLQSPDAASVNIALAPNAGMVVTGISTFNNRVLIGTTIEGAADADDLTIGSSTNTAGITIRTNTAGTGRLWFSDGTSGDAEYQGYIQYDHNNQRLSLGSGGSTRINISSTGDVGISSASPRAKLDVKDANTSHPVILRVSADNATPYALVIGNDDHNTDANNGLAMWVGGSKTHHIQARTSETASENKLEIEAYEITLQTGSSMNRNFYFDQGGRLLIGTSTEGTGSGDNLTIADSGNMGLTLRSTDSNYCNIYFSDATSGTGEYEGYVSYSHQNNSLEFATSHVERLRIASNGDFGFNDTSPTAHASGNNTVLSIKGKGSSYSGKIDFKDSSGNIDSYINSDNSVLQFYCDPNSQNGNTAMQFFVHGGERVRIDSSGEVFIGDAFGGANRSTQVSIVGADQSPTGVWAQVGVYSNDSQAANKGGSLSFGGQDGSTPRQTFAAIKGAKENSTSGNYAGYMAFYTRPAGDVSAERMRISSTGQVTKPSQIAFHVWDSVSGNAFGSNTYADWNSVVLNRGNCYSTSTGRFTCTVAGTYGFWCNMLSNGSARLFHEVRKNGSQISGTRTESGTTAGLYQTNTTQAILELVVGDWVAIHVGAGGAYGSSYSSWCGYLLG